MIKNIFVLSIILFSLGCSHALHLTNVSDIDSKVNLKGATRIRSEGEQFVVMGFVQQTDFVNEAYHALEAKCPGEITGIQTRYSTSHGFLSWTNKVKLTAWCLN